MYSNSLTGESRAVDILSYRECMNRLLSFIMVNGISHRAASMMTDIIRESEGVKKDKQTEREYAKR
jgi:hypothetical protein